MYYKILTIVPMALLLSVTMVTASENITAAMERAGFTVEQVTQVEQIMHSTQQKGLNKELVVDKLQEGISKQVAPDRIIGAIDQVTSRYSYAHDLAKSVVANKKQAAQLGDIVAASLASGLTKQDTEKIFAHFQAKHHPEKIKSDLVIETMLTARDMSRRGVKSTTTIAVVENALQSGFSAKDMRSMRSDFNRQGTSSIDALNKGSMSTLSQGSVSGANHGSGASGSGSSGDSNGSGSGSGNGSGGKH